jgi:hypothetical protein
MSSPGDREWARAFAKQAEADHIAYNALASRADVPECQSLHFLQMMCEKLAKAHLYNTGAVSPYTQASHAYVAKVLPIVLRTTYARANRRRPKPWLFEQIRGLAREIELLAPSIDGGGQRPDNCEYPWEDRAGQIHTPSEHDFPELNMAFKPAGVEVLKLIPLAIRDVLET